eukprot:1157461-Pelagomonas_calceolata.AAC.9
MGSDGKDQGGEGSKFRGVDRVGHIGANNTLASKCEDWPHWSRATKGANQEEVLGLASFPGPPLQIQAWDQTI